MSRGTLGSHVCLLRLAEWHMRLISIESRSNKYGGIVQPHRFVTFTLMAHEFTQIFFCLQIRRMQDGGICGFPPSPVFHRHSNQLGYLENHLTYWLVFYGIARQEELWPRCNQVLSEIKELLTNHTNSLFWANLITTEPCSPSPWNHGK